MKYCHKFDLKDNARLALNYLTRMVDRSQDCLPYWLVSIHLVPPFARHCRVDDAELVASWYEGIVAIRRVFGLAEGADVQAAFKRHLLKSWGEHGLRFHEKYPWTDSVHSSFHEMAYVLGALNRSMAEDDTEGELVRKRARELVEGLRKLAIVRKTVTFWGGDDPQPQDKWQYEFANDVYFKDRGWDLTCHTGRGEHGIRDGMMLHSLVRYYQLSGHATALDLAGGMARQLLGTSRYFNYKGEFFGHVHSAVWVASGLALLGRITGTETYVSRAREIFEYVRGLSSSFGWVPEYAQWHPPYEEHSETCCIKDMIQCALELARCGYEDCWDVVNRYARNQLIANQITDTSFLTGLVDNTQEDRDGHTWKGLDQRVLGGFSGGAEPNSISLLRFRAVAGCCIGTAPQALAMVYEQAVTEQDRTVWVNVPLDRETPAASVAAGYPEEAFVEVKMKRAGELCLRTADWMGPVALALNGLDIPVLRVGQAVKVAGLKPGDVVRLSHPMRDQVIPETVRGVNFQVHWRGPDVVRLEPAGLPLRLYVRTEAEQTSMQEELRRVRAAHKIQPTQQR